MPDSLMRQIAMLELLPRTPRKISAPELHERLKSAGYLTSLRTVQRDLHALSRRFPIVSDEPAKPAGWSWRGAEQIDIPRMDPAIALTFSLAERFLTPLLPRSSLQFLAPYFKRADSVLAETRQSGLKRWAERVRILPRGLRLKPVKVASSVLTAVYDALLEDRRLSVRYRRKGETRAERFEINPLGLVFRDAVVYLVCTFWEYNDIRQLALQRVQDAEVMDQKARAPRGFDLDDYIGQGEFGYRVSGRAFRLAVLFDQGAAQHLHETAISDDQKLTQQKDGRILVEATVQDTSELRWWLFAFGEQVEVVRPARLRKEFSVTAKALARRYAK